VRALADELRPSNTTAAEDIGHVEEMIRQAITEARSLAHGIFPVHVDRLGLATALADLAESSTRLTSVAVRIVESGNPQAPSPEVAMHLYRIAQEAVANAVKHSGAREVAIRLEASPAALELRVEDDGCGISDDDARKPRGMGLRTMQYRSQALGTDLIVKPRPGGGTVVSCYLPLFKPSDINSGHVTR
jgi:signal transduction histidine kinase